MVTNPKIDVLRIAFQNLHAQRPKWTFIETGDKIPDNHTIHSNTSYLTNRYMVRIQITIDTITINHPTMQIMSYQF